MKMSHPRDKERSIGHRPLFLALAKILRRSCFAVDSLVLDVGSLSLSLSTAQVVYKLAFKFLCLLRLGQMRRKVVGMT